MGGVALSHRKIWEHVAATDELALVLEDDVYTHPDIALWGESHRAELEAADIALCARRLHLHQIVTGQSTFQTLRRCRRAGSNRRWPAATDGSVPARNCRRVRALVLLDVAEGRAPPQGWHPAADARSCVQVQQRGAGRLAAGGQAAGALHAVQPDQDDRPELDRRAPQPHLRRDRRVVLAPRPLAYTENDKTQSQVDPRNKSLRRRGPPSRPG